MKKFAFIDRDGCLVEEPHDEQVDALAKIRLLPGVIPALLRLKGAGYTFILVSNQDGLGTSSFPQESFDESHEFIMRLFKSQGVEFAEELICPHFEGDGCGCRKPKVGLLLPFLHDVSWDRESSFVVGDRPSDLELAKNMGLRGFQVGPLPWKDIASTILDCPRVAEVSRKTKETAISVRVNLDQREPTHIKTGLGFFDHMLESLSRHAGISMEIDCTGDLHVDEHHTMEDVGLVLGEALKKALGDKAGVERFGFVLPMDEAQVQVALDLSGRSYFKFDGQFQRERVGELPTEMVPHFFRSLSESLGANLHVQVEGDNEHHKVEAMFKGVARCLKQAVSRGQKDDDRVIPSTKGSL